MADRTKAGTRAASKSAPQAGKPPLTGLRVLDFGQILAGPFSTRLLADLGADVVKVETATRPERMGARVADPDFKGRQDRPASYLRINRNKRSITIDLKTEGGLSLAKRLASVTDVLLENFSAGVMGRLGLDYESLEPLNPGIIYVSMSGYGHEGPRRDWTSMNMNLQAYSGLMLVTGEEGDQPTSISNSWNDYIGGLHACFGVLHALSERAHTGVGRNLDLAQFECSVATLGPLLLASAVNGTVPPRLGNRSTSAAPQGCYRCAGEDEWCTISVRSDEEWQALVGAMGSPAWAKDDRFETSLGRLRHHDEIDGHLEAWTSGLANTEVETRLKAVGVPAERMRRIKDLVDSPDSGHVFHQTEDPPGWPELMTGVPFAFERSAVAPLKPAPGLGEHTHEVLGEWLDMPASEIGALEEDGALK